MADTELTDLTGLTTPASGDALYIVDVSDTSGSAGGTSKKVTASNLMAVADDLNSSLVTLTGTQTLTNKTLTAPIISTISNTGTLTLPTSTDTLVGRDTTDTLTNKTLTTPTITTPEVTGNLDIGAGVALRDANNNELLKFTQTGSAVNELTIANNSSGNNPSITASGEANVGIELTPAGTGKVDITTNDLLIGSTANIQPGGSDPTRTIVLPAPAWKETTTAGCAAITTVEAGTNDIDYQVLDFDTTTDESAFINFVMPVSWDGGVINFRYVWTTASGGAAETVVFELAGRSFGNDEAIDQANGTAIEVSDTWIADGDIHISDLSADVTLAGTPAGGEWVHLEITRDVSEDDLGGDARLIAVIITYAMAQYSD